jgi:hypothetical protein
MKALFFVLTFLVSCSSQKLVKSSDQDRPEGVPSELPDDNAPPLKNGVPGFIRFDQQEDAMLQAVNSLAEFDRLQTRFVICSDEYNADGIDAVKPCKDAVTKALNSISQDISLNEPKAIGPGGSILQVNLKDFGLTPSKWRLIENADLFKFTSNTIRGKTIQFLTQTQRPFINASNFIESALVKAYYGIEGTPANFIEFQRKLGINLQEQFDQRDPDVIAFGMNESVITSNRQFRLIIRGKGTFGPLWCTSDTNDVQVAPVNVNGQLINLKNLLEAPFPVQARTQKSFQSDAGECIYVKPNGMLGFAIFDAVGAREDFAATNVVQDTASASRGLSSTITNARSCFRCHATGFIPLRDSIGDHIAANTSFSPEEKKIGRIFFKSADIGAAFLKKDNDAYAKALNDIDVGNPTEDPINNLVDKLRLEQDARQVAGRLGITEEELKIGLRSSTNASAILGPLLQPSGKVNLQALIDGLPILIEEMNLFEDDI